MLQLEYGEDAVVFAEMLSLPNDGRYPALEADAETLVNDTARSAKAIKGIAGRRLHRNT